MIFIFLEKTTQSYATFAFSGIFIDSNNDKGAQNTRVGVFVK